MSAGTLPDNVVSEALAILLKHLKMPGESSEGGRYEIQAENEFTVIRQLQLQEEKMESAITVFTDVIKRRIASLRRQQNHFSPIHRLPTEILASIFEIAVETQSEFIDSCYTGAHIAKICSSWREIALSTPRLWNYLHSQMGGELAALNIERSRNTPLNIFVGGYLDEDERHEARILSEVVVPHLIRWETFECYSEVFYGLLRPHLGDKSLPLLRTFNLFFEGFDTSPLALAISHNAPRLRSLEILPCMFPLGAPVVSRLRRIALQPGTDIDRFLPEQWHCLLSSCLELEFLDVDGDGLEPEPLDPPQAVDPLQFSLPQLKSVNLSNLPVSMIAFLLSSICSEQDTVLVQIEEPWTDGFDEDSQAFELMFPQTTPNRKSLLTSIGMMTSVSAYSHYTLLTIDAVMEEQTGSELLHYSSNEAIGPASSLWRTLIPPSILPNLREIDLQGRKFFEGEGISSILHLCTSLERLFIRSHGDRLPVSSICLRLSLFQSPTTTSGVDISYAVPCPNLKLLGLIIESEDLPLVANMVQARYGGSGVHAVDNGMVQLEELRLSGIGPDREVETTDAGLILQIREILNPLGTIVRVVTTEDFHPAKLPGIKSRF